MLHDQPKGSAKATDAAQRKPGHRSALKFNLEIPNKHSQPQIPIIGETPSLLRNLQIETLNCQLDTINKENSAALPRGNHARI
jgi:hypothetical protein